MLKKRITGVITCKQEIAVQSFAFNRYLPIGSPFLAAKNLDRWEADDIIINDISATRSNSRPNPAFYSKFSSLGLRTPLIYSGGIHSLDEAISLIQAGFERVVVTHSAISNPSLLLEISSHLGSQAVILGLPFTYLSASLSYYDYLSKQNSSINYSKLLDQYSHNYFSEILLIDSQNDGFFDRYSTGALNAFLQNCSIPLILFGGVGLSTISATQTHSLVTSYGISNCLFYKEHAIQNIKSHLDANIFRPPSFSSNSSF